MSTLIWLVVAWLVGRGYWKRSPAFRDFVRLFVGGHSIERVTDMLVDEKKRQEAEKTHTAAKPVATQPTSAASPHSNARQQKKPEKQFQEL